MSNGVNKVILIGNLGRDPESRDVGGQTVANFSIATTESWKDKNTDERKERTEWHNCVAWRRLGEIVVQYLRKGSKVYVEGKLQTRKWQGKDGQDKYTTEIVISEMQMLGGKGEGRSDQHASQAARPAAPAQEEFDDYIPF